MNSFDRIMELCDERGVSQRKVEIACGMSHGVIRRWKDRDPSADRLQRVADYFGVTIQYLLGETDDRESSFYLDPEVAMMTQEMKDRPELKVLFNASKDLSKQDLQLVLDMIERMK